MKVHFIAIGGSAMHNLAIALLNKGYQVSGSDDEIFEPSKSHLLKYDLLPAHVGWDEKNITRELDAVILGMHARADNPELLKAKEFGIKIFSYPEFLYEQSKKKLRVVIGGSHGKTTITAMILHVLRKTNINTDYMVGAQLDGFEVMVQLSDDAPFMIIEGDEYLTSPLDPRPKFHLYQPNIALISGIAWDHINVFKTFEDYIDQFASFIDLITPGGSLIFCENDETLRKICFDTDNDIEIFPYSFPDFFIKEGQTILTYCGQQFPIQVFGEHNLLNLNGARLVCNQLGVSNCDFYKAIQSFTGASRRLELIAETSSTSIYKDFAHSPSKLKATVKAVKEQFRGKKLVACMELHTFSSLSQNFLSHYAGTMDQADVPLIYYNPHALQLKKLPPLTPEQIKSGFGNDKLEVFNESALLYERLMQENWKDKNLLMMSSGDFDGIILEKLARDIIAARF
ncbi:MAG: Mur ligase domain-containing protein [Bacteroidetes bacterium]|nr:Mur ligase domain-containing protein [Bacteroidota bacterium]